MKNRPCLTAFILILLFMLTACSTGSIYAPIAQQYEGLNEHSRFYLVKKGDTLFSIAWQSRNEVKRIARWNRIKAPYLIFPGQRLSLRKVVVSKKKRISRQKWASKQQNKDIKQDKKQLVKKSLKKNLKVYWQWPLKGSLEKKFSIKKERDGIDILARRGAVVKAAADGKVVYSGSGLIGYGNLLIIKHGDDFLSAYGFNRRLLAKEGAFVKRGEKVAEVGLVEGRRRLHFEIRRKGKPVDPLRYLPRLK